jgi:hypothetical protein
MFSKFAVSAAIVISAACPALAATKHHHRVTHVHPTIYNMVPDTGCPANGGPSCSTMRRRAKAEAFNDWVFAIECRG